MDTSGLTNTNFLVINRFAHHLAWAHGFTHLYARHGILFFCTFVVPGVVSRVYIATYKLPAQAQI
jgi:hypothetical protein